MPTLATTALTALREVYLERNVTVRLRITVLTPPSVLFCLFVSPAELWQKNAAMGPLVKVEKKVAKIVPLGGTSERTDWCATSST